MSIACGLCAIISPESCVTVCPVAAIFCGSSGYACTIKGAFNDNSEEDDEGSVDAGDGSNDSSDEGEEESVDEGDASNDSADEGEEGSVDEGNVA